MNRKIGDDGWRVVELTITDQEYSDYMNYLDWQDKDNIARRLDFFILNSDKSEVSYTEPVADGKRIYTRISPKAFRKFMSFPRRGRSAWLVKEGFRAIMKSYLLVSA